MRTFHVYILSGARRRLYVGVTSNLHKRPWQHRHGLHRGFTARYRIHSPVYFEQYGDAATAIAREMELRCWRRERKERLVSSMNAGWRDLATDRLDDRMAPVDPGCSVLPCRRS